MESQVNILFRVKVKEGREEEFYHLAGDLMKSSREEDGCVTFTYHQNVDNTKDFFLYEQWRDQDALKAHIKHLQELLGPPDEGKLFPAKLEAYWDEWKAEKFNVVRVK